MKTHRLLGPFLPSSSCPFLGEEGAKARVTVPVEWVSALPSSWGYLQPGVHIQHVGMLGEAGRDQEMGGSRKAPAMRHWEQRVCLGESRGTGHFAQLPGPAYPVQVQTVGRALPALTHEECPHDTPCFRFCFVCFSVVGFFFFVLLCFVLPVRILEVGEKVVIISSKSPLYICE